MARDAVPAWTVKASSATATSLMWCEEFPRSPVDADRGGQVGGAGFVGVEADDGVEALP
ncbi:hypothetical protein [Streptomyces turgidiscabies]|uniref:Uncharacterized protein n=1 Tax=Streptomyces turgidiscabies TaxID=85558 RepID=A0ABU0RIY0_9ACTN|nr:hypothetical protein [Streptomyces turgidiscabies]MDQ0930930.1 hypothetical protein [Streptomyces turgidiscabies]